jgi:hypothetical protein
MTFLKNALDISVLIAYAISAVLWYRASKINTDPGWGEFEPVIPELSIRGWLSGILTASKTTQEGNKKAALCTAFAVALSTCVKTIDLIYPCCGQ